MHLKIIRSGPLTTIQDNGRFGYLEYGIGESGVMDKESYQKANALVGNTNGEAVLEATLLGPVLEAGGEMLIGFMGADMPASIDDRPIKRGQAYRVKKGQRVSFGMAVNGVRSYIAFAGGINVPEVMGSRSTNIRCKLGGLEGRKLEDNDSLPLPELPYSEEKIRRLMAQNLCPCNYASDIQVRVILGPQQEAFTDEGIKTFLESRYTVSNESDRMGIRLTGEKIEGKGSMDIVSDGVTFGSIQVTSAGLPVILMADHQTTGGYAKIATVVSADLPLLAQARPGDQVSFQKTEIKALLKDKSRLKKLFRNRNQEYMAWKNKM